MKNYVIMAILLILVMIFSGCNNTSLPKITEQPQATEEVIVIQQPEEPVREVVITQYKSDESAKFLWDSLNKYTDNPKIAAGVMGYFYRESFFRSDAVAGYHCFGDKKQEMCDKYTAYIDAGLSDGSTKDAFIYECLYEHGGYGLGQWCSRSYTDPFFDFAQEWGTSIADAEMQCAFIIESIMNHDSRLYELIKDEESVFQVGFYIGTFYDGTHSEAAGYMGQMSEYFYNTYMGIE